MLPNAEHQYLLILSEILDDGVLRPNRTGIDSWFIPGAVIKADLSQGFPLLTTKKMAFGQIKGELIGFLRGYKSAASFRALGCTIWDANANQNREWLANTLRKGEDDLGRIYGAQWRDWQGEPDVHVGEYNGRESVDQLAIAIRTIMMNPNSRRIIVSAWNPGELHLMALPPCHLLFQFLVDTTNRVLHMCMYQRSCDMFLGVPFNIASYALLLTIVARITGYMPGIMTMMLADAHIYVNHEEAVREQLERASFLPPVVRFPPTFRSYENASLAITALSALTPDDIELGDYMCHPAITAPMAL